MNAVAYFEIQADDLARASKFYFDVFGWEFTRDTGTPVEYMRIKTDGANGGMLKRPAPAPASQAGTNAFVCSVEVEDFDATVRMILESGGKVALPKFAVPGKCWQGYFIDTEGNTFGLFQADTLAE